MEADGYLKKLAAVKDMDEVILTLYHATVFWQASVENNLVVAEGERGRFSSKFATLSDKQKELVRQSIPTEIRSLLD